MLIISFIYLCTSDHWHTSLPPPLLLILPSLLHSLSIYQSIYLSFYISISLSIYISLYIYLSLKLSSFSFRFLLPRRINPGLRLCSVICEMFWCITRSGPETPRPICHPPPPSSLHTYTKDIWVDVKNVVVSGGKTTKGVV